MLDQSSGRTSTETSPTQKPVLLPQVRYHPSIQNPGGGVRVKTANKTRSSPTQEPVLLPQVWYHPSIQISGGGAQIKTSKKTRTGPTQRTEPGTTHYLQTRTDSKEVQENQEAKGPTPVVRTKPVQKPAVADPDPAARAPPTPEQVPLDVGRALDRHMVEQVEVLTRGQSINPDWFAWRKNRITASVAHRIARCRFVNGGTKTPPTSYLAAITGEAPRVQTRAMSWGVRMEAEAQHRYKKLKSASMGHPVSIQDCGLFIDAQRPWLAASPDGIVTDTRSGQWLLCLEVKCPYKHRERRVEDACRDDPAFCLQIKDEDGQKPGEAPVYRLKTSHSYFTQVQCQLAVTGLQRADFVVFTLKETAIVPVTFDPDLWEETVSKLEVFYRDAVLPHIRQKTQEEVAAAWTPEL